MKHGAYQDATPTGKAGARVMSLGDMFGRIWFLAIIAATFNFFSRIEGNIMSPYLYTRVRCCQAGVGLDSKYDIANHAQVQALQDEATRLGLPPVEVRTSSAHPAGYVAACSVPDFPSHSSRWSLSPTCVNKAFVQDTAQGNMAIYIPLQKIACLLLMPVGSAISDTSGRRGVLLVYAIACTLSCILFAIDSQIAAASIWRDMLLYLAGALLCCAWEPKDSLIAAAIADILGHDAKNKSRAMFLNQAVYTNGTLLAFIGAFICTRWNLRNYFSVWIVFAGIALSIVVQTVVTMKETLPTELRGSVLQGGRALNPVGSWLKSWQIFRQDPVLMLLAVTDCLYGFAFVGFLSQVMSFLIMLGWSTSRAMVPGIMCTVLEVFFAFAMVPLIVQVGVFRSCVFGHVLLVVSFIFWGPITLAWDVAPYLAAIFLASGHALYIPARATIASERVGEAHQGKCLAGLSIAFVVGVLIGAPIYSHYLFSGSAEGQRRALPQYVSLTLSSVNVVISSFIAAIAPNTPPAYELMEESRALDGSGLGAPRTTYGVATPEDRLEAK